MSHLRGSAGGGIGGLVKRNAWYAGWFATMAAAGWAIDELHNQVMAPVNTYTGQCRSGYSWIPVLNNVTYSDCQGYILQKVSERFSSRICSDAKVPNASGTIYFTVIGPLGVCDGYMSLLVSSFVSDNRPVSDDALYDSLISTMLQDPEKAAQAFMVPDAYPYPYPQIFPETIPYIPGVSEADQQALDLYYRGLLQSTNPNAPNYVTPERYQQIADLANKLQQGQTPQGQTDQKNDQLKKPLTQAELEETLKKRDAEQKKEADDISKTDTKPVTDAYKDSKLKDEYDKLKERVSDPTKMPQLPPLPAADQIDLPSYKGCQTITVNLMNGVLTFPNPDQCKKLEQVKTGLGYLMYVLTALGIIMELFRRVE